MKQPNPMRSPGGPRPISKNRQATLLCSLLVLLGSVVVCPRTLAQSSAKPSGDVLLQPSPINYPPGLCYQGQRDLSGSWVNDGTGNLVPLTTLCNVAIQHHETIIMPPVETAFWQAFITAASPDALEFANEASVENVVAYGQTICPSLNELGTMHELRMAQVEGGLPASFDAAVNVAAIHTYCPEKTRSIGR